MRRRKEYIEIETIRSFTAFSNRPGFSLDIVKGRL